MADDGYFLKKRNESLHGQQFTMSSEPKIKEHIVRKAESNWQIVGTSFSLSSASLVLNFFWTSLIRRKAVFRLDDGAEISPGSFVFELRYVLMIEKMYTVWI